MIYLMQKQKSMVKRGKFLLFIFKSTMHIHILSYLILFYLLINNNNFIFKIYYSAI